MAAHRRSCKLNISTPHPFPSQQPEAAWISLITGSNQESLSEIHVHYIMQTGMDRFCITVISPWKMDN